MGDLTTAGTPTAIDFETLEFRKANPHFREKPATLEEFLGPGYLNLGDTVRPAIREVLKDVFGEEVEIQNPSHYMRAFFTGGIGIGKTTVASIALCYLIHWVLCLKDAQDFFGLMPDSTIAFMMMSTSEKQAKDVIFGDVKRRIKGSPWFQRYPYLGPGGQLSGSNQVKNRFEWPDHNLVLIPLGSEDTAAEGYNILGGVIDELDSGKITDRKVYMEAALDAIENRIRSRYGHKGLIFSIGQMKALASDEPVLTPKGWREIGSLAVGDEVIGSNGAPTTVKAIHFWGASEAYRLTTTDGASVRCDGDHIWGVVSCTNKAYAKKHGREPKLELRTTREMFERGLRVNRDGTGQRLYQVPLISSPVDFGTADPLPIAPYALGALLGDGSISGRGVGLTSADPEIVERVAGLLPGTKVRTDGNFGHYFVTGERDARGYNRNWVRGELDRLGLDGSKAETKFIPEKYLRASVEDRLELLRGLMDTDGSHFAPQNTCRYTTISPQLAADVQELVRSLGGICTAHTPFTGKYRNDFGDVIECKTVYILGIRLDVNPFWLPRKADNWQPRTTNPIVRSIDSIEPDGHAQMVCIQVDAEDGLFVTKDYLLTHNSMSGFAARLFEEYSKRDDAYAVRMTIWESRGLDYYRDEETGKLDLFYYDIDRKEIVPSLAVREGLVDVDRPNILQVPSEYLSDFKRNPEKALRDLAGIPPAVADPFISYTHKIVECRERWEEEFGELVVLDEDGRFHREFRAQDSIPRWVHIDIGFADGGDAAGIAMGHVRRTVEVDDELKPYIVFDALIQKRAVAGHEIMIEDLRQIVYQLSGHYGFNIRGVSLDGFQSTDSMQQFRKRYRRVDYVSIDKEKLPYYDLKDAIYEDRLAFPRYMVRSRSDETRLVELAIDEISQLTDAGKKIDHTSTSTKDLADAMAGVVTSLMGDRRFHRNVTSISTYRQKRVVGDSSLHPAYRGEVNVIGGPTMPSGHNPTPKGVISPWQ